MKRFLAIALGLALVGCAGGEITAPVPDLNPASQAVHCDSALINIDVTTDGHYERQVWLRVDCEDGTMTWERIE